MLEKSIKEIRAAACAPVLAAPPKQTNLSII